MGVDIDMGAIEQLFIEESIEGLDIMESGLLNLDLGAADPETMNSIFRAAHSIKGGGATFGFTEISEFAHHLETLLDEMRQGDRPVTREAVDLSLQSVDCIRAMIDCIGSGEIDTTCADELEKQLTEMLATRRHRPRRPMTPNLLLKNRRPSKRSLSRPMRFGTSTSSLRPRCSSPATIRCASLRELGLARRHGGRLPRRG